MDRVCYIPTDKRLQSATFGMLRDGRTDVQLLADLLEVISQTILFYEIHTIAPSYTTARLDVVIVFKSY